jgi:hypothetical protein
MTYEEMCFIEHDAHRQYFEAHRCASRNSKLCVYVDTLAQVYCHMILGIHGIRKYCVKGLEFSTSYRSWGITNASKAVLQILGVSVTLSADVCVDFGK